MDGKKDSPVVDVEAAKPAASSTRAAKPSPVVEYAWQLFALLFKNSVLFRRNWVSSLVHLFAPAIFVLIFGISLDASRVVSIVRQPASFASFGGVENGIPSCQVFDSVGGRFGYGFPQKNAACFTIAWSPNTDPNVENLMRKLSVRNGLNFEREFIGFQDQSAMLAHMNGDGAPVYAGVVFDEGGNLYSNVASKDLNADMFIGVDVADRSSTASVVNYIVMLNETVVKGQFLKNAGTDKLAEQTSSQFSSYNAKSDYGLQVQRAVNEVLIEAHSGSSTSSLEVDLKALPLKPGSDIATSSTRQDFFEFGQLGVLFYLMGIMMSFVISLKQMVQEKEDKILDALRMMGLYESCYWASWWIYYLFIYMGSAALMIAFGRAMDISAFVYTDGTYLFTVILVFLMNMAGLAMFLSTLMPTTRAATIASFLFVAAAILLQLFTSIRVLNVYGQFYNEWAMAPPVRGLTLMFSPFIYTKLDQSMFAYTKGREKNLGGGITKTEHASYTWDEAINGMHQYAPTEQILGDINFGATPEDRLNFIRNNVASIRDHCLSSTGLDTSTIAFAPFKALLEQSNLCYSYVTYVYPRDATVACSSAWRFDQQDRDTCVNSATSAGKVARWDETAQDYYFGFGSYGGAGTLGGCDCFYNIESDMDSLGYMCTTAVLYVFLAWYMGQVVTFGHGRAEKPWFILTPSYWFSGLSVRVGQGMKPSPLPPSHDVDVTEENNAISRGERNDSSEYPVLITNLVKQFGGLFGSKTFRAVDGLNLSLRIGECFALLGHNGAGKTTAINCLSGMTSVSGGDAKIYGKSVATAMSTIRHDIGVCPQHDILWDALTAREHLRFYGHFQGMSAGAIRQQGEGLLKQVHLDSLSRLAGNYSGGMRRRLSMAVAALGNKRIIFLDEPTTGLDPQNQKHVWDLINDLKKDRVVILTTHLMDEADTLGDRIGIMSKGRLIALGNPLHLKSKFGSHYKISITVPDAEQRTAIDKKVLGSLPHSSPVGNPLDASAGPMVYDIPPADFAAAPAVFRAIDGFVSNGKARDWGLSQTSLEDIFVSLEEATKAGVTVAQAGHGDGAIVAEVAEDQGAETPTAKFKDDVTFHSSSASQIRALWIKSYKLQLRQKKTLCCQILIPLALIAGLIYILGQMSDSSSQYDFELDSERYQDTQQMSQCEFCMRDAYRRTADTTPGYARSKEYLDELRAWLDGKETYQDSITFEEALQDNTFEVVWFKNETNIFMNACLTNTCDETVRGLFSGLTIDPPTYVSPFHTNLNEELQEGNSDFLLNARGGRIWVVGTTEEASLNLGSASCDDKTLEVTNSDALSCDFTYYGSSFYQDDSLPALAYGADVSVSKGESCTGTSSPMASNFSKAFDDRATGFLAQIPARLTQITLGTSANSAVQVSVSPNLCVKTTETAVNDAFYTAQEQVGARSGDFAQQNERSEAGYAEALRLQAEYFPDAVLSFSELNPTLGRAKFTIQSYYSEEVDNCGATYSFANVKLQSDSGSDGSDNGYSCPGGNFYSRGQSTNGNKGTIEMSTYLMNSVTSAMLRTAPPLPSSPLQGAINPVVSTGFQFMPAPEVQDTDIEVGIESLFIGLATSFLLPVLVFHIVHEKELKLRASMSMMGLKMRNYWLVQYVFDIGMSMVSLLLVYVLCSAGGVEAITNHQFGIVLITLVLWAHAQIALAFLLSTFFSRTRNANIALYLLVFVAAIGSNLVNFFVFGATPYLPAPAWWIWWPQFAYFRCIELLTKRSYFFEDLDSDDELVKLWGTMVLQTLTCFAACFYLDEVLPKQYGVRRGLLFPLQDLISMFSGKNRGTVETETTTATTQMVNVEALDGDDGGDDLDVAQERRFVLSGQADGQPIVVKNLQKNFGYFTAVSGVSFHITKGCSALLGPNGAGKSTVCSMLTGLYPPSGGDAFVNGYSITKEMPQVYSSIGVCPQHDIFWPSLTVREHLTICAGIKGASSRDIAIVVKSALEAVKLLAHSHKPARALSGGQRRRMSIAMSFIGSPKIIFLDEPTTGVDPSTRLDVHQLILREQEERCIVLTTHLMSEAEKLSKRIGIMAHGALKTIGTSAELKDKYNEGFKLILVVSDAETADGFMAKMMPQARLESRVNQRVVYRIGTETKLKLADVFEWMNRDGKANGISDWSIEATSLEDVFLKIASESEAQYGTA